MLIYKLSKELARKLFKVMRKEVVMHRIYIDMNNLRDMLFDRKQILSLVSDDGIWNQIPLEQRFDLVDSFEFRTLMGDLFTEGILRILRAEAESLVATIH